MITTFVQLAGHAYILPIQSILNKTSALAGNSIISIEQNVVFREGGKDYLIKETWLIEGDKNLKLTATGEGELKDLFRVNFLYNGKNRTQINGKNKVVSEVNRDFFEKFLATKSTDSFLAYFKELGISDDVRLSRAGGSICFAIGQPSTKAALSPQIWIDQNSFQLKKMRTPSEAEIEFSDFGEYGSLQYPGKKNVAWADKNVVITVTRVNTKTSASLRNFYPDSLDQPSFSNLAGKPVALVIEDFYKRFR